MKLADLPVHDIPALSGNNAPVHDELVLDNLPVIGELPADLNGLYVRNGPNPYFPVPPPASRPTRGPTNTPAS